MLLALSAWRQAADYGRDYLDYIEYENKKENGKSAIQNSNEELFQLEFENVSFKYPGSDTYVIKNLNLKLNLGERLAIVGKNGPVSECDVYAGYDKMVGNKAAIYISHRLASCRFCKDILVFDAGRIVQHGSHDDLVRMQAYTRNYGMRRRSIMRFRYFKKLCFKAKELKNRRCQISLAASASNAILLLSYSSHIFFFLFFFRNPYPHLI